MRAEWVKRDEFAVLLGAMMPQNRLVMQVALATGLRVGDVLAMRTEQIRKGRFTIREEKTGKARRVYIPQFLRDEILRHAGRFFAFEGRCDAKKHRTRAAVYKDLRRVAVLYRLDGKRIAAHVSTHTARKIWAVDVYHEQGLGKLQERLNHADASTTLLYAMADQLTKRG